MTEIEVTMPDIGAGHGGRTGYIRMHRMADFGTGDLIEVALMAFEDGDMTNRRSVFVGKDFIRGILNRISGSPYGEETKDDRAWTVNLDCTSADVGPPNDCRAAWIEAGRIDEDMFVQLEGDSGRSSPNPVFWFRIGAGGRETLKVRADYFAVTKAVNGVLRQFDPMDAMPDYELEARRGEYPDTALGDMMRFEDATSAVAVDDESKLSGCAWLVREQAQRALDSLSEREGWTHEQAKSWVLETLAEQGIDDPDCVPVSVFQIDEPKST